MNSSASIDVSVTNVAHLLNREIGLRAEPTLRGRLERSIREDAASGGLDIDTYVNNLTGTGSTLQSLVNRVTVQETAFFRHPEHFALLAGEVLRGLAEPVNIWSAACSNGQEAYSLAMLMDELGVAGSVIASDLSTTALERTVDARYTERELLGLSPQRIARHLDRQPNGYRIKANVRARVVSMQHNLLDPIPDRVLSCQVVLCRNVLIYFSPEHGRSFLDRLSIALPEARLFLGGAETIWQLSDRYETVRSGDTFSYRRRAPTTPLRPPRPPDTDDGAAHHRRPRPRRVSAAAAAAPPAPAAQDDPSVLATLSLIGQRATATGDVDAAVVAFRKCAYLAPDDPMTHLNLGLALEAAGDHQSARRAYAAARQALSQSGPTQLEHVDGYTTADLIRLIEHKQQAAQR